ncbi:MAG: hypothetical protein ACFB12_23085 [Leptolyngbyaceae cyanobacterium]
MKLLEPALQPVYRFARQQHQQAGDRGPKLSTDNGKIKSDLSSRDITYFRFNDRELRQD